jgi:hypothetical protein
MLFRQLPQAEKIFGAGHEDAAFALDALDENSNRLGRDRGLDGGEVVERYMREARQERLEAVLDFLLPGRGERGHGPAVKGIRRGDDFVAALIGVRGMAELPRHLDQRFVRFGTAVAEKNFSGPGQLDDPLRELSLPLVVIKIGTMDKAIGLLVQCFFDRGMRVAEAADGDARPEVEVLVALVVPHVGALAFNEREAPIDRGHDVLVVERLSLRARGSLRRGGKGGRFRGGESFDGHGEIIEEMGGGVNKTLGRFSVAAARWAAVVLPFRPRYFPLIWPDV